MFIYIIAGLAIIVLILVAFIASRPSDFRVTRSAAVGAPAEAVFAQVNDLRNWEAWSPWAKIDPNAKQTYDGPRSGAGATFAWSGNNKIGEGRMEITESRPNELVRFKLEFLRPFKATNAAEFTFKPHDGQTVVTWTMSGRRNFITKAIGLVLDCDKMCGCQFEKGLAQLDSVARAATPKQSMALGRS
jgi:hypothetical protein